MTIGTYSVGPAKRPNITHDNGFLDKFAKRAPTVSESVKYSAWKAFLEAAESGQKVPFVPHNDIPDALAAYRHFLYGKGRQRSFSYDRYLANDNSGKMTLKNIIAEVKAAVIDLHFTKFHKADAAFDFTGSGLTASLGNRHFPYPTTENWQKAIGAHNFWLSGSAEVRATGKPHLHFEFLVDFEIHVEDRYNFNPDQKDLATGIPDGANGIFEVTGLAHQYMNVSTVTRSIAWIGNAVKGLHTLSGKPLLRARQPGDNARMRNQM